MTQIRRAGRAATFGDPVDWPPDDLVAVSAGLDPTLVRVGYACGVFPMPVDAELIGWWSPVRRAVLPLDGLRVSRSLRKMLPRYEIRVDTAFDAVLAGCADPRRRGGWIDERITGVYRRLHEQGWVHSVEAWAGDALAGGLYGVSLGGLFAGESMFHDPEIGRDASKAALAGLVDRLRAAGPDHRLLDVQWRTDHLASLGAVEWDRADYLRRLPAALARPAPRWADS